MKLQPTLRQRLVLLMVFAMVPLLGLSVLNADVRSEEALSRATDSLKSAASLAAFNQQQVSETANQLLIAMASIPAIREGRDSSCALALNELSRQLPGYSKLGIVSAQGYDLCNTVPGKPPLYVGDRSYFRDTVATGRFVAGEYIVGRLSGKPSVAFALPVLDGQGALTGVVYAALDLSGMDSAISASRLPAGAELSIYDRNGASLTGPSSMAFQVGQKAIHPVIEEAVKTRGSAVRQALDGAGRQRLWAYTSTSNAPGTAFIVAVSMERDRVVAPIQRGLMLELAALVLVALLGAWLAWRLGARGFVRPAADILKVVQQFQQGGLDARVALRASGSTGELQQIASAFNSMADALQAQQAEVQAELCRSRAAEQKLRDAQLVARLGYWQFDVATQRLDLSDDIFSFYAIDPALFTGTLASLLGFVHASDRPDFKKACRYAIQSGSHLDIEFRVVLSDGDVRWIHQFGPAAAHGAPGESGRRTGVIQDITARKQAELALVRSTELLNRTGTLARVGGWELQVDTMTPHWSEETYRIYGVDASMDVSFEDAVNFFSEDARPVIHAAVRAAIERACPWDLELPLVTAVGRLVWVRVQGQALIESGKVVRLIGVMQDVTVQHGAQAHARLLETCISRLNDVVMIIEAEPLQEPGPRIVFVNDAFERLTGYSRDEVLGKSPRFLQGVNTQRHELERISTQLQQWKPVRSELVNYTKSGAEFWIDLDVVPVANEHGRYTHWVAVERDITERKRAEQALASSEQRYTMLFNMAPVPMWIYDAASHRYLAVNQAASRAYGYSEAEFLSMSIFDIRPVAEHAALRQWLADPSRKNAVWHDRCKDGSLLAVETVSRPIQYAGLEARFVIALDRSAQEKMEKDVQDYLFTLQRAADAAQAITWHRTVEGTMQEIVEQARGVIGAHQAAVSLLPDAMHPHTLHALSLSLSEKYEASRGTGQLVGNIALQGVTCAHNRPVRMTQAELEVHPGVRAASGPADPPLLLRGLLAVPLLGRDGQNLGVLQLSDKYEGEFTKQDEYVALELGQLASAGLENARLLEQIGQLNAGLEQKVAERTAALSRQEALFRALAEQAPQMVWMASPDGRATYYNRAWFELIGGALQDWTGYQWLSAIHPEDIADIKSAWAISRANGSPYAGTRRLKAKSGGFHTMAYRASPVLNEQGTVDFWVGIDADVTEIKAIEAALRLSNQELEAFSYSVSHDLRSPLNTIDGFSRLLAKQLAPKLAGSDGADKIGHYLTRIQAGVAQMGQLIEDLLALSQVSRAQLQTQPVNLSGLALGLLDEFKVREPGRKVTVTVESGLLAHGDERLVRVMMENLLNNAWKFTAKMAQGDISVGKKSDLAGVPVFFVRDNGAGFNMAYADKLFQPFQRLHAAADFSGTGIGLATVSRVVRRHGGRIWVESSPGLGATFFFTLG